MWQCPMCKSETGDEPVCPVCGFDITCDYERFPTLCADIPRTLKGMIEKKAEANSGSREGSDDRAAPIMLSERADRYFLSWVNNPANTLPGWTITCPVKSAIRWSYKQIREYTLSVTEEGIHIENINNINWNSEQWRKEISWEEFLSGRLRTIGFHVELQRYGRKDLCLAAIADNNMLKSLLKLLVGLQEELCGEAFPHRQENLDIPLKQADMTYAWSNELLTKAKAFIQNNRQPWPDLFPDPGKMQFFRTRLCIPMSAEIYLAHTWSALKMNLGRNGWAITDQGVYSRDNLCAPTYASWPQFLNGTLRRGSIITWSFVLSDDKGRLHTLHIMQEGLENSVSKLIIRLQAYLRKESLALQGGN